MKINKLLERQLKKQFPNGFGNDPALVRLVEAVNNSYNSYERDSELTSHFFRLSEKEYVDLTNKLSDELDLKEQSILELKKVVSDISGEQLEASDNSLPGIIAFLQEEVSKRQTAEKERSSLSQRLSSLILNMQDGLLVEDEHRRIIIANQVFCDMFGIPVPPETLTGADCTDSAESNKHLFEDPEKFVDRISVLIAERKPVVQEELELKDGRYFSRDFIPIYEGDEYLGHFWKYKDTTQEKVNMRKLEKSELKTRLIMNGSPDAIITINFNGRITHWNQHAEQLFGWSENEVLNELLTSKIIPLEFRRKHLKNLIQHRQTGTGFMLNRKLEATALHRDGHEFPVEVLVVPLMQDGAEFFCYYIRDISERLRTERELRLISMVASLNKNGVIFTDTSGRIKWANDGFLELTGYERDEIMGHTPIELLRGDLTDKESMHELLNRFYKSENFTEEINCYRKDSTFFWARISGQYISGEKDGRPKYFAVIEDITREKETQEKLMEFNNRFREALVKIGDNVWEHDFSAGVTTFTNTTEQLLGIKIRNVKENAAAWWAHVHRRQSTTGAK
ncbi:MAG: PAS domain S-box protein [Chitinophagaceae bacterium]|nr:PAS domain S-box protein [Chitinophagaceae bacterium]